MQALALFLALALLGVAVFSLRLHWRLRETERLLATLARRENPGARSWAFSPELAALVERSSASVQPVLSEITDRAFDLETVLSSMSEGVMVTDAQCTIRLVNQSFRTLFRLTHDPAGASVIATLREAAVEELVRQTFADECERSAEIAIQPAGDATMRYFKVNAVPLLAVGETTGAVFVFHDITQLRQLETVRREFVSNVSHELRTPLSIFHGYVENLLEDPAMPELERREIHEILAKHSLRLNALLEDLLTLARLEGGRLEFEPVPIEVAAFLEEFAADWHRRMEERGIAFRVECQRDLPGLTADALRLEQVLTNLLANAEKFTASGGEISVRARASETAIEFSVEDTGQGIPSKDLPHIFERFYRVDKARSREKGGTGLGLSIVKHIMALHQGSVEARSQLGKGTTVSVSFPRE